MPSVPAPRLQSGMSLGSCSCPTAQIQADWRSLDATVGRIVDIGPDLGGQSFVG